MGIAELRKETVEVTSKGAARPPHVVFTPISALDRLKPHWRGLADKALTANPFMAPEFLEPAAMHLTQRDALSFAAVYRPHSRSEELIGLFAMSQAPRRSLLFGQAALPSLWTHPCFSDATPLLSRDPGDAVSAVKALLDAVGAGRRGGLALPSVAAGSAALSAITEAAERRGLVTRLSGAQSHSRGLHLMLQKPVASASVTTARDPAPLMAMLEQALAMDAQRGDAAPDLGDPRTVSFMRAAVRGFSHTRAAVMGRFDDGSRRAAALAWLSADKAFIWRFFGPDAGHPTVEAALAHSIGKATGRTPVAATLDPVVGFCMAAHPTVTARLSPAA